jgi:phosphoglycerate dehydrogenase-like enzyme
MKFKNIVCLGYSGKEMEEGYWKKIDAITEKRVLVLVDDAAIDEHLRDADCLLIKLGAKVSQDMINKAPNLKYIGMYGTGVGGVDLAYAASRGITVCNIADYATEGVAEFTFGAILEYFRELERAKTQAQSGDYSEATFAGTEIKNKKFGIIGLGHIGRRTAEIALGFGAEVSYWSKNRKADAEAKGIHYAELKELLSTSDIISLNLTLNPETNGMISRELVQSIKKGALLVNPSPMELLDLGAVVEKLQANEMSFILDHSDEMTTEQLATLKPYKNCVIYPPIAYTTKEATALKKDIFVGNLENFLKGEPTNKVN